MICIVCKLFWAMTDFILQQNNYPKHSSLGVRNYLEYKVAAGMLSVMGWPVQSPDLIPIALVSKKLDQRVWEHCTNQHSRPMGSAAEGLGRNLISRMP